MLTANDAPTVSPYDVASNINTLSVQKAFIVESVVEALVKLRLNFPKKNIISQIRSNIVIYY